MGDNDDDDDDDEHSAGREGYNDNVVGQDGWSCRR